MVRYSLIIPARDSGPELSRILPPLASLSPAWEVLVIDDHSPLPLEPTVGSALARAKYVRSTRSPGAAGARNHGGTVSKGEILVFLDSDVEVSAEVLEGLVGRLDHDPELSGVFGCYSARLSERQSSLSRFRNLLHRYVHRHCAGRVESFWTGLGAVRRDAFAEVGGFDEALFQGATIEDVEFGARLADRGHQLLLDPNFQGVHLKAWTLFSLVKTDILQRAAPWTRLLLLGRLKGVLNASWRFRLGPLLLLQALLLGSLGSSWTVPAWLLYFASQSHLWFTLLREGGWRVGLVAVPGTVLHHLCCWLGAALGAGSLVLGKVPPSSYLQLEASLPVEPAQAVSS